MTARSIVGHGALIAFLGVLMAASAPAQDTKPDPARSKNRPLDLLVYDKGGPPLMPDAKGKLVYSVDSKGVFFGTLELTKWVSNRPFVACLNAYPGHNLFPRSWTNDAGEKETYVDIRPRITENRDGKVSAEFEYALPLVNGRPFPPGQHTVKFFIKVTAKADSLLPILYNDNLTFDVEAQK